MTFIRFASFRYILAVSISSRLLVIIVQLLFNLMIEDHDADAYRNRYHKALANDTGLYELLPTSYRVLYSSIEGLTKWDAQYFLEISLDGYTTEQHLAFLPLFPMLISYLRQSLFGHKRASFEHFFPLHSIQQMPTQDLVTISSLENYIQSCMVAVAINNFVLVPVASALLFALTKLVRKNDDEYAKTVVWSFCFNPASIFFTACYSESLFATLTFSALLIIEHRSLSYIKCRQTQTGTKAAFKPLSHLNRLIYIALPALVPLALASGTRSNGLITIGFIIFQFLIKYVAILWTDWRSWSLLIHFTVLLEFIQDILVLVMSSVLAASGYISYQVYSFLQFCTGSNNHRVDTHGLTRPLWCNNTIPHSYGYVQAKYWNVGLFRYYEVKQLPNFLLALPISSIVLFGSLKTSRELTRVMTRPFRGYLAYYLQAILLTLLCSVSINIQVITRLIASSCPAVYWICVDMAQDDRRKRRALMTYFLSYFVIGAVLHTNFYPWT